MTDASSELHRAQMPDVALASPKDPNDCPHVVITMSEHSEPLGAVIVWGKENADNLAGVMIASGLIVRVMRAVSI